MIAIIVCVGYSNLLKVTLKYNINSFKEIFVVTCVSDKYTQELCAQYINVHVINYTFNNEYALFDKGGAIRHAQQIVHSMYPSYFKVIIDADICVPLHFNNILKDLDKDTVYGSKRLFFKDSNCFNDSTLHSHNINDLYESRDYGNILPLGYFQLYFDNTKLYKPSLTTSICDTEFTFYFNKIKILDQDVKHIGESTWCKTRESSKIPEYKKQLIQYIEDNNTYIKEYLHDTVYKTYLKTFNFLLENSFQYKEMYQHCFCSLNYLKSIKDLAYTNDFYIKIISRFLNCGALNTPPE